MHCSRKHLGEALTWAAIRLREYCIEMGRVDALHLYLNIALKILYIKGIDLVCQISKVFFPRSLLNFYMHLR